MAIGYHNYPLAIVVSAIVVIVLFVLEPVQRFINKFHRVKDYRIKTLLPVGNFKIELEKFFEEHEMTYRCMKTEKKDMEAIYIYRIGSPDRTYDQVNDFLLEHNAVKSFEI